jgi:hypothetical protein
LISVFLPLNFVKEKTAYKLSNRIHVQPSTLLQSKGAYKLKALAVLRSKKDKLKAQISLANQLLRSIKVTFYYFTNFKFYLKQKLRTRLI